MTDPTATNPEPLSNGELGDIRNFLSFTWRKKWWIFLAAVAGAATFATIALLTLPVYRAAAILIPTTADTGNLSGSINSAVSQLNGIASLVGMNIAGGTDAATEEAIAVLKSRSFSESFIADLGITPELTGEKGDAGVGGGEGRPVSGKAWRVFNEEVRFIDRDRTSGLVTVRVEWRDRLKAAIWANQLVERLNAEMRRRSIVATEASIEFLRKELGSTSEVEIRTAINRLIEVQISQRMLASVTPEFAFRIVDAAYAPDADDPIRPKRGLMIILGTMLGALISVLWIYLQIALQGRRFASRAVNSPINQAD